MQEVQAFAQEIVGKSSPVRAALLADFTERLTQREKVAMALLLELVNRDGASIGSPMFTGYVKGCLEAADQFIATCSAQRSAAAVAPTEVAAAAVAPGAPT